MKQKLKYNITAILIYLLFWFILAERINFQAFTVGLMICLVVYNFNRDNIEEFFGKNFTASQKISCIIKYVLLLVKEIRFFVNSWGRIPCNPAPLLCLSLF